MIKKCLKLALVALLFSSPLISQNKTVDSTDTKIKTYQFTKKLQLVPHTKVKNQGLTGTCWSYATSSWAESEVLRKGKDTLNLSEFYISYYNDYGSLIEGLNLRMPLFNDGGAPSDYAYNVSKHGLMPREAYMPKLGPNKLYEQEMASLIKSNLQFFQDRMKTTPLSFNPKKVLSSLINMYLGIPPKTFQFKGKEYTPQTFSKEVVGVDWNNTVSLYNTGLIPYYEFSNKVSGFQLDYADTTVFNIPLDEYQNVVDHALEYNYSLVVAISAANHHIFDPATGIGYIPEGFGVTDESINLMASGIGLHKPVKNQIITQEYKDSLYLNGTLSLDHAVQIIGTTRDSENNKYYIIKNSWGTEADGRLVGKKGLFYVTPSFLRLATAYLFLNRDALSKDLNHKITKAENK